MVKITKQDVGRSYVGRNGNIYTIMSYDKNRKKAPFIVLALGGRTEQIDENGHLLQGEHFGVDFVRWVGDEKDGIIKDNKAKIKELEVYSRNITLIAIIGWFIVFCFLLSLM